MTMASLSQAIAGLAEVADRFDALFIDQFGVLHDGSTPYPQAIATLRTLSAAGKRVVLLSNSGKRAARNAARLTTLGIAPDLYQAIVTSGEVGWAMLAADPAARRCLLLTRDDDRSAIAGLPITVVDDAADCDFVLIAGSEGDRRSLDSYRDLFAVAAARGVPALCTNPDFEMLTAAGLRFGAGRIAQAYEALGGTVTWIGKPYPAIYAAARALVPDIPVARILCVGDSIDHDIAGAAGAGLAGCLVRSGIVADIDGDALAAMIDRSDAKPDFILSDLRW